MKLTFSNQEISLMIDYALKSKGGAPILISEDCEIVSLSVKNNGTAEVELDTGLEEEEEDAKETSQSSDAGPSETTTEKKERVSHMEMRHCETCGDLFQPYSGRQKYCNKPECKPYPPKN